MSGHTRLHSYVCTHNPETIADIFLQAIQWVWPVVLLIGLPFAPESPYWLIRKNRKDDARKALEKLSSSKHRPDIDSVLVMIEQTDLLEQELESTTTYMDCFKGANLPRTEISIMVYLIQVIGGNPLIGYANFFFEQAGLNSRDAFNSKYPFFFLQQSKLTTHSGFRRNLPLLASNVLLRPPHNLYHRHALHDGFALHNRLSRFRPLARWRYLGTSNTNGHLDLHLPDDRRTHLLRHNLRDFVYPS